MLLTSLHDMVTGWCILLCLGSLRRWISVVRLAVVRLQLGQYEGALGVTVALRRDYQAQQQ